MFAMKYLDGTPVDTAYEKAITGLVGSAAQATQLCTEDELEQFAASQNQEIYGYLAKAYGGIEAPLQVMSSAAGYYLGTSDEIGCPNSRESVEYWPCFEDAERALASGAWTQRPNP